MPFYGCCRVQSNTFDLNPREMSYQGQSFSESIHYYANDDARTEDEAWASAVSRFKILVELDTTGILWVKQDVGIGCPDDCLGSLGNYTDGSQMTLGRRHTSYVD